MKSLIFNIDIKYLRKSLIFNIKANYEVNSINGTNSLIITNLNSNGTESNALDNCYIIIGSSSLFIRIFIIIKNR